MKQQRGLGHRHRQHLERDLRDHTQRAHGPGHQARHVVTRHVFHHLPAKGEQLAPAVDDLHAQHIIAHIAHRSAGRATQTSSDHATNGGHITGTSGEVRGLKRQVLALCGEHRFQLSQWRTGAHGHHQLAGLITDDTLQAAGVQHVALQRLAVKVLAAATTNAQWLGSGSSGLNAVNELGER